MLRQILNFCEGVILRRSSRGIRSRRAASLTWCMLRLGEGALNELGGVTVAGSGATGAGCMIGSGAGIGAGVGAGIGAIGLGAGTLSSGISIGSNGAIGSGSGATISTLGSGKGPTGSPSSPVSPSGIEDGAATGSEKTGSVLVVLVMSSIAFCRSLSTV